MFSFPVRIQYFYIYAYNIIIAHKKRKSNEFPDVLTIEKGRVNCNTSFVCSILFNILQADPALGGFAPA